MTRITAALAALALAGCLDRPPREATADASFGPDSLHLVAMIAARERAMVEGDVEGALSQFADDATWINSQGYYFAGKSEVAKFHAMLAGNDSLGYAYQAGHPLVRVLDGRTAVAYYSWRMTWYRRAQPADTTFHEIGLMTLIARRGAAGWRWVAVTNQHTPDFALDIEPVRVD
ncbi:MAG: DUF4440 domain-containing protein [Gemmatimonadales bacterium]